MDVYTNVDPKFNNISGISTIPTSMHQLSDDEMQVANDCGCDKRGGEISWVLVAISNVSFGINQAVETNRDWGSTSQANLGMLPALEYDIYDSTASIVHDVPYNYPGTDTPV